MLGELQSLYNEKSTWADQLKSVIEPGETDDLNEREPIDTYNYKDRGE